MMQKFSDLASNAPISCPHLFQVAGRPMKLYLELEFEKPQLVLFQKRSRGILGGCGAQLVDQYAPGIDYVIATHMNQPAVQQALRDGVNVANIYWVFDSISTRTLQASDQPMYKPYPARTLPGFEGLEMSFTGFSGPDRSFLMYETECTGATLNGDLIPGRTTHLLVHDVNQDSAKVKAIRERQHTRSGQQTKIVLAEWIRQCLRQWRYLPEEPFLLPTQAANNQPSTVPQQQPDSMLEVVVPNSQAVSSLTQAMPFLSIGTSSNGAVAGSAPRRSKLSIVSEPQAPLSAIQEDDQSPGHQQQVLHDQQQQQQQQLQQPVAFDHGLDNVNKLTHTMMAGGDGPAYQDQSPTGIINDHAGTENQAQHETAVQSHSNASPPQAGGVAPTLPFGTGPHTMLMPTLPLASHSNADPMATKSSKEDQLPLASPTGQEEREQGGLQDSTGSVLAPYASPSEAVEGGVPPGRSADAEHHTQETNSQHAKEGQAVGSGLHTVDTTIGKDGSANQHAGEHRNSPVPAHAAPVGRGDVSKESQLSGSVGGSSLQLQITETQAGSLGWNAAGALLANLVPNMERHTPAAHTKAAGNTKEGVCTNKDQHNTLHGRSMLGPVLNSEPGPGEGGDDVGHVMVQDRVVESDVEEAIPGTQDLGMHYDGGHEGNLLSDIEMDSPIRTKPHVEMVTGNSNVAEANQIVAATHNKDQAHQQAEESAADVDNVPMPDEETLPAEQPKAKRRKLAPARAIKPAAKTTRMKTVTADAGQASDDEGDKQTARPIARKPAAKPRTTRKALTAVTEQPKDAPQTNRPESCPDDDQQQLRQEQQQEEIDINITAASGKGKRSKAAARKQPVGSKAAEDASVDVEVKPLQRGKKRSSASRKKEAEDEVEEVQRQDGVSELIRPGNVRGRQSKAPVTPVTLPHSSKKRSRSKGLIGKDSEDEASDAETENTNINTTVKKQQSVASRPSKKQKTVNTPASIKVAAAATPRRSPRSVKLSKTTPKVFTAKKAPASSAKVEVGAASSKPAKAKSSNKTVKKKEPGSANIASSKSATEETTAKVVAVNSKTKSSTQKTDKKPAKQEGDDMTTKHAKRSSKKTASKRSPSAQLPNTNEKQSAGADNAQRRPLLQNPSKAVFAVTCMENPQKDLALRRLKGLRARTVTGAKWVPGTTHMLMGYPLKKRSDKALAALAAGCWLLNGTRYLVDCDEDRKLVSPHAYELQEGPNIAPGAPQHWREKKEQTGAGAYVGLRIAILGSPAAPLDEAGLKLLVEAGNGQVAAVAAKASALRSLQGVLESRAPPNVAVVADNADEKLLAAVQGAGIPCVAPSYLVSWIANPWEDLSSEYRNNSKPSRQLESLEAGRGQTQGAPASCMSDSI